MKHRALWLTVLAFAAWTAPASPARAQAKVTPANAVEKPKADEAAAPQLLPTVKEILAKFEAASGDRAQWKKFTSRQARGFFQTEDAAIFGGIEILSKAPDKVFMKVSLPGNLLLREVCDGKSAWVEDPFGGVQELTGVSLQDRIRRADFYGSASAILFRSTGKVLGTGRVGTHMVYIVQSSPREGLVEKIYFDVDSGLVVREDMIAESEDGPVVVENYLDDYRQVDGIRIPFRMRRVEKGAVFTIRLTQLRHNVPVDDALFQKRLSP